MIVVRFEIRIITKNFGGGKVIALECEQRFYQITKATNTRLGLGQPLCSYLNAEVLWASHAVSGLFMETTDSRLDPVIGGLVRESCQ